MSAATAVLAETVVSSRYGGPSSLAPGAVRSPDRSFGYEPKGQGLATTRSRNPGTVGLSRTRMRPPRERLRPRANVVGNLIGGFGHSSGGNGQELGSVAIILPSNSFERISYAVRMRSYILWLKTRDRSENESG